MRLTRVRLAVACVSAIAAVASLGIANATAGGAAPQPSQNSVAAPGGPAATPSVICKRFFAVVNADATLARGGCGVAGVTRGDVPSGSYVVFWNRDATRCATLATIGISGNAGIAAPGFVDTAGRFGNSFATYVVTRDTAGNQTDRPFHIALSC
jgi:hypothetical protein